MNIIFRNSVIFSSTQQKAAQSKGWAASPKVDRLVEFVNQTKPEVMRCQIVELCRIVDGVCPIKGSHVAAFAITQIGIAVAKIERQAVGNVKPETCMK